MSDKLYNVTKNLRELIKALPAVQENCNKETINRHLQLIAYFQRQYDNLVQPSSTSTTS
ncbi:MAG: hypothetical protein AB8B63_14875 [Granulosicoccus sp.]